MKMFGSLPAMLLLVTTAAAQQVRFDDVVRNLRNPDPEARMSSITLLRESKYLEAIEPIATLVNDPIDEIQLAAIERHLTEATAAAETPNFSSISLMSTGSSSAACSGSVASADRRGAKGASSTPRLQSMPTRATG